MFTNLSNQVVRFSEPARYFARAWFDGFARRFLCIGRLLEPGRQLLQFFYNTLLIVQRFMDAEQKAAFEDIAMSLYNVITYPLSQDSPGSPGPMVVYKVMAG